MSARGPTHTSAANGNGGREWGPGTRARGRTHLHHALEACRFLERVARGVLVLWVHELRNDTVRRDKRVDVRLQVRDELVRVARVGRDAIDTIVDLSRRRVDVHVPSHPGILKERVDLIVLNVARHRELSRRHRLGVRLQRF